MADPSVSRSNFRDMLIVAAMLCMVQLGFAGYNVVLKLYAQNIELDPKLLVFLRTAMASLFASSVAVFSEGLPGRELMWPEVKWDLLKLGLTCSLGLVLNPIVYIYGLYGTSPLFTSLISQLNPIVCVFVAIMLKQEPIPKPTQRLGAIRILGFIFGITGSVLEITMTVKAQTNKQTISAGVAALIVAVILNAMYFVLQRKFFSNNPNSLWKTRPLTVHATMFMLASVLMTPLFIYSLVSGSFYKMLKPAALIPLSYATIVNASVCYMMLNWCNYRSNSSTVTASWPLQVVFSAVLSATVLGERFFWYQGVSAVLVLSGLLMVVFTKTTEPVKASAPRDTNADIEPATDKETAGLTKDQRDGNTGAVLRDAVSISSLV